MKIKTFKKKYLILVTGKTEVWYLQKLKEEENLGKIDIQPQLPKKTKFDDIYQMAMEEKDVYDKIIIILDFDTFLKEAKERQASDSSFQRNISKINKLKKNGILVLINNPCLEVWFLSHFKLCSKFYNDCSDVIKELKNNLKGYEKSEKVFIKNNIYRKLEDKLNTAIQNAKALGDFNNNDKTVAEIYKLFEILGIH